MAETEWKWRIMLFVRAADNTPANRQAFSQIFVDGGSGESLENEEKIFDSAVRLSTTGQLPAQAFGVSTAAKGTMRTAIKALLDSLTNARYVVVANTTLPQYADGELIDTNFDGLTPSGQIFTWQDTLDFIFAEFGVQPIVPETI